jgi:hypothetical protein
LVTACGSGGSTAAAMNSPMVRGVPPPAAFEAASSISFTCVLCTLWLRFGKPPPRKKTQDSSKIGFSSACRVGEPLSSRPVGRRRSAALHRPWKPKPKQLGYRLRVSRVTPTCRQSSSSGERLISGSWNAASAAYLPATPNHDTLNPKSAATQRNWGIPFYLPARSLLNITSRPSWCRQSSCFQLLP